MNKKGDAPLPKKKELNVKIDAKDMDEYEQMVADDGKLIDLKGE